MTHRGPFQPPTFCDSVTCEELLQRGEGRRMCSFALPCARKCSRCLHLLTHRGFSRSGSYIILETLSSQNDNKNLTQLHSGMFLLSCSR